MEDLIIALKALSEETRINIIKLLLEKEYCVRALAKKLGTSEASVSQHLKILREAGILIGEKRGYFTHYQIKLNKILWISDELRKLSSGKKRNRGRNCGE